jgi:hypothetical protein
MNVASILEGQSFAGQVRVLKVTVLASHYSKVNYTIFHERKYSSLQKIFINVSGRAIGSTKGSGSKR